MTRRLAAVDMTRGYQWRWVGVARGLSRERQAKRKEGQLFAAEIAQQRAEQRHRL